MPTLMPWTTVEIGDVEIFSPSLPSLVVYTWYVDDGGLSRWLRSVYM